MKTKKTKKIMILALLIAMFAMYGVFPLPDEASAINSLTDASATIDDSDLSVISTTTMEFTTASGIDNTGYIEVTIHDDFTTIPSNGNISCSGGGTATGEGTRVARCTYAAGVATSTTITIGIGGLTNPDTDGDRTHWIRTYDSGGVMLDRVGVKVYIIEDVLMTANVDPVLEFSINGVLQTDGKTVNGVSCERDTTSTSTPFGLLTTTASTTICQRLNVTTNADDGYAVTVEQDQELTSDSGSNINSFDNSVDGTGSSTSALAHGWVSPNNTLDQYHTYGHMGLTSDDQDLNTVGPGDINFYNGGAIPNYVGFNGTDPVIVMSHDGPSDGLTQNVGEAFVAYTAEIGSLQEAGDYENTLTYIATPTY